MERFGFGCYSELFDRIISGVESRKVKFTLERATHAQRGDNMSNCTLSLTSALDGVDVQRHPPGRLTLVNETVPILWDVG